MAALINSSPLHREQDLLGQTVVVIGGSSGIGLETARLARAKGADIILTAREPDRLHRVGLEFGASIAAFDATDFDRVRALERTGFTVVRNQRKPSRDASSRWPDGRRTGPRGPRHC